MLAELEQNNELIVSHTEPIKTEDNSIINYNYEYDNNELYIKNLEVILKTHYDFYDADYAFYFEVLAELEQNNELIVSHTEPINEEVKI